MTKNEAVQAMKEGKKVTHRSFTENEWMTIRHGNLIETEDGYWTRWYDFWKYRTSEEWQTGYSIWDGKEGRSDT